jgi:hypothetical protein
MSVNATTQGFALALSLVILIPRTQNPLVQSGELMHGRADLFSVSNLLMFLLVPPITSLVWLLLSRGLTDSEGTSDDDAVKGWTQSGFWIVLCLSYAGALAMFIYAFFVRSQ